MVNIVAIQNKISYIVQASPNSIHYPKLNKMKKLALTCSPHKIFLYVPKGVKQNHTFESTL